MSRKGTAVVYTWGHHEVKLKVKKNISNRVEKIKRQVTDKYWEMSDKLAKAFISETGLKPSECELVQQIKDNAIIFYYRKRVI